MLTTDNPMNAPRYSSPASATGSSSTSSTLATGVLIPNSAAEMMAYSSGLAFMVRSGT